MDIEDFSRYYFIGSFNCSYDGIERQRELVKEQELEAKITRKREVLERWLRRPTSAWKGRHMKKEKEWE